MKKCNDCNIEMIENTNLHTDYVGGASFEEQIYITYVQGGRMVKNLFGKEKQVYDNATERIKARVCPSCGKVELYVDLENTN